MKQNFSFRIVDKNLLGAIRANSKYQSNDDIYFECFEKEFYEDFNEYYSLQHQNSPLFEENHMLKYLTSVKFSQSSL